MVKKDAALSGLEIKHLNVFLLTDGKPGHYHSSEGIVNALARLGPVTVTNLAVRRLKLVPMRVLSYLIDRDVSPAALLQRAYGIDRAAAMAARCDLIVSAGGETLAANVALARLTGAPNIFFGSLRSYKAQDFTLALNSYTTHNAQPNQRRILKPAPADPAQLPTPELDHRRLPRVAGLLIGGPSGDARFEEQDWAQLATFLEETRLRLGIAWIVSNSRRTPAAVSDHLAVMAQTQGGAILRFVDVRTAGPGTLGALFAESGAVVVTADSSAMLSEAIWMRRPAISLRPKSMALAPKEAEYRRWLEERNLCREVALADLSPDRFASLLREIVPLTENPQVELAHLLARELPALFAA